MKLVVALGNPGDRYHETWHNLGFFCLDAWADHHRWTNWQSGFRGSWQEVVFSGMRFGLLKPMTFMNLSGESVSSAIRRYRIAIEDLLVLHDDKDLTRGRLQLRFDIGSAGHKGVQSIIESLGSKRFYRLRLGIGAPELEQEVTDYVLQPLTEKELNLAREIADRGARVVDSFFTTGPRLTMNRLHASQPRKHAQEKEEDAENVRNNFGNATGDRQGRTG